MERQMDLMREQHHAQVFRLLTKDIAGKLTVERHADFLSALADIIVDLTVTMCWRKIKNRHRDDPKFAVLAYGKLGGKELGYASDLDMVFVHDDDAPESAELYTRLGQRTNTWLSAQTPAGQLFETDLRLRPNGDSGLMVVSLEAFRQYQLENAWVWEHQALTRARFCAGDREIGASSRPSARSAAPAARLAKLRDEVLAMRQRMADAHPNKTELFDLKHDRGGLIDVEFIVQYLVLGYAHQHASLTGNLGNIALLGMAGELGLIPADQAAAVADSYREYRRLQHGLRLNNQASRVPREQVAEMAQGCEAVERGLRQRHPPSSLHSSRPAAARAAPRRVWNGCHTKRPPNPKSQHKPPQTRTIRAPCARQSAHRHSFHMFRPISPIAKSLAPAPIGAAPRERSGRRRSTRPHDSSPIRCPGSGCDQLCRSRPLRTHPARHCRNRLHRAHPDPGPGHSAGSRRR
jgi:hypothetical protein